MSEDSELWETKELICHYSSVPNLAEKMGRHPDVLKEHNIDDIVLILDTEFGEKILHNFFKMIGFDCLIGHGDRHWTNYGVKLTYAGNNLDYKFAPIYDTASGYLLEMTDAKVRDIIRKGSLDTEEWYKPKKKGLCKIICNKDLKTNHIELFEYILDNDSFKYYISALIEPIKRFNPRIVRYLLRNNFHLKRFSAERKNAIMKVLEMRKKILDSIIEKYTEKCDV